jgi:hypothetical protein
VPTAEGAERSPSLRSSIGETKKEKKKKGGAELKNKERKTAERSPSLRSSIGEKKGGEEELS